MSSIPYIREGSSNVRMPKDYGYVYAQVNDWAGLGDLVDPKEGDVVSIQYLPISTGGFIPYPHKGEVVYTSEGWKLTKAEAFSKVKLDEYITVNEFLAVNGCIGIVCGNAAPNASSDYYYWSGTEWLRTPDGTGYIHPTVASWDSFPSDNVQVGDRVYVSDLDPGLGFAQWDGTDWKLVEGVIDTIADLLAFTGEKELGAKVTVGTGIAADPVYFWSGTEWLRTADQSHYIWPQVNNWSLLTTDRPHAINNDEVPVHTLNVSQSSGTAQLHGGTWKLIEGKWPSVTDMNNWNEGDIHSGAIAYVDPTHEYDQDSTVYYYAGGAWVATQPAGVTKVHTISSLSDFSASGLTEGDYGIYTSPAGGLPVTFRYKAAVTRAASAGSGTVQAWLPPEVYAGTPVLQAYLVGTESVTTDTTLNAQGWSTVTRSNGTITSQTTRVRLATSSASADASIKTLGSGVEPTTKIYSRALTRMQVGSGTGTATAFCSPGACNNLSTGIIPAYLSSDTSKRTFFWNGTTTATSTGFDKPLQTAVADLSSSSDDTLEIFVNTAGGLRACEMYRNGILVSSTDQVVSTVPDRVIFQVGSFNMATASLATLDLSQVQVFTW